MITWLWEYYVVALAATVAFVLAAPRIHRQGLRLGLMVLCAGVIWWGFMLSAETPAGYRQSLSDWIIDHSLVAFVSLTISAGVSASVWLGQGTDIARIVRGLVAGAVLILLAPGLLLTLVFVVTGEAI